MTEIIMNTHIGEISVSVAIRFSLDDLRRQFVDQQTSCGDDGIESFVDLVASRLPSVLHQAETMLSRSLADSLESSLAIAQVL